MNTKDIIEVKFNDYLTKKILIIQNYLLDVKLIFLCFL